MIIDRVLKIIDFKGINKNKFYIETGLSNGFLDKVKDIGGSKIEQILNSYPEINPEWLLTGEGVMLKTAVAPPVITPKTAPTLPKTAPATATLTTVPHHGIPLIPLDAVAGFGNGEVQIHESEVQEYYEIPMFEKRGAKYLIAVSGNSMYPKYNSGDLLACKPITDISFFQWGKPYVLDTDQGPIVKRIYENPDNANALICKSDNYENYPPFPINKDSIYKVAIVVGVIRLE